MRSHSKRNRERAPGRSRLGRTRRVGVLFFVLSLIAGAIAADDVVEMKPVRAVAYDIYCAARYDLATEAITEIRVTDVKAGSKAEKLGLRVGDRITAIDGVSVVGRKRAGLVNANQAIVLRGSITFAGHRGLLRKEWSLTVDAGELKKGSTTEPGPSSKGR